MRTGALLHNRLSCNDNVRIVMDDGTVHEGIVTARTGNRVALHVGGGIVQILRRVDIRTVEIQVSPV